MDDIKELLSNTNKYELKALFKEALKEWLDEKASAFGRMSLRFVLYALVGVGLYFWLAIHGWKAPA